MTASRPEPSRLFSPATRSMVLAALSLAMAPAALAQAPETVEPAVISGRVVLDDQGVPGNPVALHRITNLESGEVASTVTDSAGNFSFPVTPVEGTTFTVYFVTADYQSVRFLGDPLHADSVAAAPYVLAVYDTTSNLAEPIRVASRDIFMIGELTGGWEVVEILNVLNPNRYAFVSGDGKPPWDFRIPEGATDFEIGEGDVLPHELSWMDGRVLQLTPLTPGYQQIFISYRLPAGASGSSLLIEEPTDTLNVFVRQPSHLTSITGLQSTRIVRAEGEEFLQYGAVDVPAGASIGFQWSRIEGAPVDPVLAAVVVTLALLALGVFAALRNRGRTAAG